MEKHRLESYEVDLLIGACSVRRRGESEASQRSMSGYRHSCLAVALHPCHMMLAAVIGVLRWRCRTEDHQREGHRKKSRANR